MVFVDLGKIEAILPAAERVPGERYEHGQRIRCLVVTVRKGPRGPQIMVSRSHPNLVKKLFALEVPEIADGTVEIAGIAREAGHRTKIAVRTTTPGVNAKGACIGPMGQRVRNVMTELHGEKIDIVDWSEDPAEMIAHALSPAQVLVGRDRRRGGPVGARRRARLPALAGDRQGGAERPPRRPDDGLADRHPLRRGAAAGRPGASRGLAHRRGIGGSVSARGRLVAMSSTPPVRTCVGCRERTAKSDLLRVVADHERALVVRGPRRARRRTGPGAHLHPSPACLDLAERRRAFPRAFRLRGAARHQCGPVLDRGTQPVLTRGPGQHTTGWLDQQESGAAAHDISMSFIR